MRGPLGFLVLAGIGVIALGLIVRWWADSLDFGRPFF